MQNVKITFLGKFKDQFKYNVSIGDENFDYHTGLGWFTPYRSMGKNYLTYHEYGNKNKKPENGLAVPELNGWVKVPSVDDVLECLFSDADFGNMSFDYFCDELGYNNDSMRDFKVYQTCMETAIKVRKLVRQGLISRPKGEAQSV